MSIIEKARDLETRLNKKFSPLKNLSPTMYLFILMVLFFMTGVILLLVKLITYDIGTRVTILSDPAFYIVMSFICGFCFLQLKYWNYREQKKK